MLNKQKFVYENLHDDYTEDQIDSFERKYLLEK